MIFYEVVMTSLLYDTIALAVVVFKSSVGIQVRCKVHTRCACSLHFTTTFSLCEPLPCSVSLNHDRILPL